MPESSTFFFFYRNRTLLMEKQNYCSNIHSNDTNGLSNPSIPPLIGHPYAPPQTLCMVAALPWPLNAPTTIVCTCGSHDPRSPRRLYPLTPRSFEITCSSMTLQGPFRFLLLLFQALSNFEQSTTTSTQSTSPATPPLEEEERLKWMIYLDKTTWFTQ